MGRPKGSKNRISLAAAEIADELEVNPLAILLHFAAGDWEALGYKAAERVKSFSEHGEAIFEDTITPELRQSAAKEACKYIFPTKKAVEFKGDDGAAPAFQVVIKDYATK